jgi:hypothetical protein
MHRLMKMLGSFPLTKSKKDNELHANASVCTLNQNVAPGLSFGPQTFHIVSYLVRYYRYIFLNIL